MGGEAVELGRAGESRQKVLGSETDGMNSQQNGPGGNGTKSSANQKEDRTD